MRKNSVSISLIALGLALQTQTAWAQDAADTPANTDVEGASNQSDAAPASGLEEIVVTAQRRSESLQRVPISITAITAQSLTNNGAVGTMALSTVTPSLQMPQNRNSVSPYIRGVGSQNVSPGDEGATAVYVDGVLRSDTGSNVFELNNVDRVEVLRGPQGTLFGRNAVGGLINIITRTPDQATRLKGSIGYGNYDTWTGQLYVAGGITRDVAADLAISGTRQGDGWGKNLNLGNDINYNREFNVRSKVAIDVGLATQVILSGDYGHSNSDIGNVRQALPGTITANGGTFTGTIYDTSADLGRLGKKTQYGGSMHLLHDFGWAELTNIAAYREYKTEFLFDTDGTPEKYQDIYSLQRSNSFQEELFLVGQSGPVDWTVGSFFFEGKAGWDPLVYTSDVRPTSNTTLNSNMKTQSYAGYGQITYSLTDALRLTGGLRYTRDERSLEATQIALEGHPSGAGTVLNTTAGAPEDDTKLSFGRLTWRAALDYQASDNVLLFGSVSRGFKSGVFSASSPFTPPVLPETLDAYEVGIKSDLFGRTVRFNLSGYYYDYQNIQTQAIGTSGASMILNAARGKIKGIDLEMTYAPILPIGDLRIDGAFSYLDATYDSFPNGIVLTPRPSGGNTQTSGDLTGNDIVFSPPFTSNLSVNYELPMNDGQKIGFNVNWYYNTGFYWDPQNRVKQSGYNLLNGQISYKFWDEKLRLRAFVRNLLDKQYYSSISVSATGDLGVPAAPRTYGVALDFDF